MNDRLVEFVIKQSAVIDEQINPDTRIETDLGVSGDDAIEFILEYGKAFNVDVSRFMAAVDIPTKVRQCSALKYPIYSGAKYASQTGQVSLL
jgi:acyl carrier protein